MRCLTSAGMDPVRPDYAGAGVAGIVPALLRGGTAPWLPTAVREARAVVLLLLDGLGWHAIRDHPARRPELCAMEGGPIPTVVPSTTPAALTSLTVGVAPGEHGIVGFRVRTERSVLNAVRWQQADGRRPPDPSVFQRRDPFGGRAVPVVTKAEFRTTGFTQAHLRGADFRGWQTTAILVEQVRAAIAEGVPFVYAYYPGVDEIAHHFGLGEPWFPAELAGADRIVGGLLDALPSDVALLVTADHGQVQVGPDGWLGLGMLDPMVDAYSGDGRFRYLHARKGAAGALEEDAVGQFGEVAWVLSRDRLLDEGWLGPVVSAAARRRVGDVVLAARAPVGFVDPTLLREAELMGAHGSLTESEMLVPLVAGRGRGAG